MKIFIKSHALPGGNQEEITIHIIPKIMSPKLIELIDARKSASEYRYLHEAVSSTLIIKDDELIGDGRPAITLNETEEKIFLDLIQKIIISKFSEDIDSIGICDGGNMRLEISGLNYNLYLSSMSSAGVWIEGLGQLSETAKNIFISRIMEQQSNSENLHPPTDPSSP